MMGCTGLSQQTPTIATSGSPKPDCVNWKNIIYSEKDDSETTIREIIASNAARGAVCGK